MIEAELPDGTILEFPDGTDPKVMQASAKKYMAKNTVAPGSEPLPDYNLKDTLISGAKTIGKGWMQGGLPGASAAAIGIPMQAMTDVTNRAAYKAGEKVTDTLAPHVPAEVAGGAGYAANVATQAVPAVIGAMAGRSGTGPLQSAGENIMHRALKPGVKDIVSGSADDAVRTLLREGANVTEGGAAKLSGISSGLTKEADALIAGAQGNVNKGTVAKEIVQELKKARLQPNPTKDIQGVSRAWDEFVTTNKGDIPVQLANELKRGGQKAVAESYGKLSRGREAGVKALSRGLRKGVEEIVPAVGPINARNKDILNALEMVERRAGVAGNRDIAGIAALAHNPQALAAMLADRSQLVKSLLARFLYSGAPPIGTAVGAGAGATLGMAQGQPE